MNSKRLLSSLLSVLVLFPAIPAMAFDNGNAPTPSSESSMESEENLRRRSVDLDNLYIRFLADISENKGNVGELERIEIRLLNEMSRLRNTKGDLLQRGKYYCYNLAEGRMSVTAEGKLYDKEECYIVYTRGICRIFINMAKLLSGSDSGMSLDEAFWTVRRTMELLEPIFENAINSESLNLEYRGTLHRMALEVRDRLTTFRGWSTSL